MPTFICKTCLSPFYVKPSYGSGIIPTYCSWDCRYPPNQEERFWSYVRKTETCWFWTGGTKTRGYGNFAYKRMKQCLAHRYAWELFYGPIPKGLEVCHNCPGHDNPACVNPAHLFLGTHKDNMHDASEKGAMTGPKMPLHGESCGASKLTESQVIQILSYKGRRFQKDVAKEFQCSRSLVGQIWDKKIWKYLHEPTVLLG